MMDIVVQEEKDKMKETILQRDLNRKARIKSLKDEQEASLSDQDKLFNETFDEHIRKILEIVGAIEERKIEEKDLPDIFNKISEDLQNLNRYLSVSTAFLTHYRVRKCMKTIEEIENKVKQLETDFLPKKKFGFKTRKTKIIDKIEKRVNDKKVDEVDAHINERISFVTISCGFSDKKNENLKLGDADLAKNDVELRNLENCTVKLLGNPSTIHISKAKQCKVLSGPVSTSVFVENCQDCDFVIACQQLRVHCTTDSRFYIHVTSRAIIEDSSNVQFAPYNLEYEGIDKHFQMSGLDVSQKRWNQVDDFNWLACDVPSPNWSEIREEDRVQSWPL